jgi:hypothetical protein
MHGHWPSYLSARKDGASAVAAMPTLAEARAASASAVPSGKKPNIIFMMVDNFGCGDLGCYGGGRGKGRADPAHRHVRDRRSSVDQFQWSAELSIRRPLVRR